MIWWLCYDLGKAGTVSPIGVQALAGQIHARTVWYMDKCVGWQLMGIHTVPRLVLMAEAARAGDDPGKWAWTTPEGVVWRWLREDNPEIGGFRGGAPIQLTGVGNRSI